MGKRKQNAGYHAAVSGAKKIVKILLYIFIMVLIAFLGKTTYSYGYDVFNQQPMASESNAQEVTITISKDMSVYEVGKLLKEKELIEKPLVFWLQEKFSDYSGKIKEGKYELSTAQTADEMLEVLSGTDEEADGV